MLFVCPSVDVEEPVEDLSFIRSLFDLDGADVDLNSFLDTLSTDMTGEGNSDM